MLDLSKLVGFDTETYPTIASLPLPEGLEHLEEYRSMAPPMVCGQFFGLSEFIDPLCLKLKDPHHKVVQGDCTGVLVTPEDAARMFMWLSQRKAVFTAANLAYDALVMEVEFPGLLTLVRDMYREGRAICVSNRDRLYHIADGTLHDGHKSSLEAIVYRMTQGAVDLKDVKKNPDAWRLRYHELEDIDIPDWPEPAKDYAMSDAVYAYAAALYQQEQGAQWLNPETGMFFTEEDQARADFALSKVVEPGFLVDAKRTAEWRAELVPRREECDMWAQKAGILCVNKCKNCQGTGRVGQVPHLSECPVCHGDPEYLPPRCRVPLAKTKKLKSRQEAWISYGFGGQPPRNAITEKALAKAKAAGEIPVGSIKTDSDTVSLLMAGEVPPGMDAFLNYFKLKGVLKEFSTYLPILETALERDNRVYSRYTTIMRTGRTSCSKPNNQNPPRAAGYRECYIPEQGKCLASIDYTAGELYAMAFIALTVFGRSVLADVLNSNESDAHVALAVDLLALEDIHLTYAEVNAIRKDKSHELYDKVNLARTHAKAANFSLLGGQKARSFLHTATISYGIEGMSIEDAETVMHTWAKKYQQCDSYVNRYIRRQSKLRGYSRNGKEFFRQQGIGFGMWRGDCRYNSGCNFHFQGLMAHGIKRALWRFYEERDVEQRPELQGVDIVVMIHDEFVLQGPVETRKEWAARIQLIMEEEYNKVLGHKLRSKTEVEFGRRWSKKMSMEEA